MSKGIPRKIWVWDNMGDIWDNMKRNFWLAFCPEFLPVLLVASEIAESLTGGGKVFLLTGISLPWCN